MVSGAAASWWSAVAAWARSHRALLVQLLKAYGVFAVLHSFGKVAYTLLRIRRRASMVQHLPGADVDFGASELRRNVHRLHEWRRETLAPHRGAPLVRCAAPDLEIVCNTAASVEFLLKREFEHMTKPTGKDDYGFQVLGEFLGEEGIFILPHGKAHPQADAAWSSQRKTAAQIFTRGNFTALVYETMMAKSDSLLRALDAAAQANRGVPSSNARAAGATAVDFQHLAFAFTFSAIQKIFFNRDVDTVSGPADEYADAFDDAHRAMMKHMFGSIPAHVATTLLLPFPFGSLTTRANAINPGFWLYKRLWDPDYAAFRRHVATLDRHTYALVAEARAAWVKENEGRDMSALKRRLSVDLGDNDRRDMLAFFLRGKEELTDKQLRDVILNFIIAGRDTTACALTWLFFELSQNREAQDKLAAEVLGKLGKTRAPTLQDLDEMPYLNAALLEALRMHPPVPEDFKMTTETVTYEDGTSIPKGTKLLFTPYAMGRNPELYPESDRFLPERWIGKPDPTANGTGKAMFEFPVFQAGPRFCLGVQLAKQEARLCTARILQRYEIHLEAAEKPSNMIGALMITMSLCNSLDRTSNNLWIVPRLRGAEQHA